MAAIDRLNGSAHYPGAKHPLKVFVGPFCFTFYFPSSHGRRFFIFLTIIFIISCVGFHHFLTISCVG